MTRAPVIRPIAAGDRAGWEPLWLGYNAFYGRSGAKALDPAITEATWARFFDPAEPVYALVAEDAGELLGLAHYLTHRSTTALAPVVYLQDLFTLEVARGRGVASALIGAVAKAAGDLGAARCYWHTHESNAVARRLYDQVGGHTGFVVYQTPPRL